MGDPLLLAMTDAEQRDNRVAHAAQFPGILPMIPASMIPDRMLQGKAPYEGGDLWDWFVPQWIRHQLRKAPPSPPPRPAPQPRHAPAARPQYQPLAQTQSPSDLWEAMNAT